MKFHGIEWKNVPEFAQMEHLQWRENTVQLQPKLKH
jgi:hypothetical protein